MSKTSSIILLNFTLLTAAFTLVACDAAAPAVQATPTCEATATAQPTLIPTQTVTSTPTPTPTPDTGPKYIGTLGEGMMSDIYRSPDGKIIAVGIDDALHWFDSETFEELGTLPLGLYAIRLMEFSSDSLFIGVTDLYDAKVVDLKQKKIISTLNIERHGIQHLKFTPDNRYIAFSADSGINPRWTDILGLWDIEKDEISFLYDMPDPEGNYIIAQPAISPDGTMIAAGCSEEVNIWELHSGKLLFSFDDHAKIIPSVDFSPDGKLLASGSGQTIFLWDPVTGKKVDTISYWKGDTPTVRFSSNGMELNIENLYGPAYTWNLNDKKLTQLTIQPTPDPFGVEMHYRGYSQDKWTDSDGQVVFSPDGRYLAVGSEPIIIFDIDKQSVISSLEGDGRDRISDFHYSPYGRWLAAQYFYWDFQVWDVENGQAQIRRVSDVLTGENTPGSVFSFAFSSDSTMIAVGGENTIEIWDVNAASQLFVLHVAQESGAVWEVSFSSDGNRLYAVLNTGEKRIAEVWDLGKRTLVKRFDLPVAFGGRDLYGPYYARDNQDENDSWIEVWNLETAEIEYRLMSAGLEEFYPNESLLFGWSDGRLHLWEAATGKLVAVIEEKPDGAMGDISINQESELLAIKQGGKVDLYDISQVTKQILVTNE